MRKKRNKSFEGTNVSRAGDAVSVSTRPPYVVSQKRGVTVFAKRACLANNGRTFKPRTNGSKGSDPEVRNYRSQLSATRDLPD